MLDPSLGLEADLSPDPLLAAFAHSPAGAWAFCICLGYRFGTLRGVSEGLEGQLSGVTRRVTLVTLVAHSAVA